MVVTTSKKGAKPEVIGRTLNEANGSESWRECSAATKHKR